MDHDPLIRLRSAAAVAIDRYRAKERQGIEPDLFAELGESVFWLVVLAEVLGRDRRPVIHGLKWARNRISHGGVVTAPTTWEHGAEPGKLVLGRSSLGVVSGHEWLLRSAVAAGVREADDIPAQNAAYDAELSGRGVLDTLIRALGELE